MEIIKNFKINKLDNIKQQIWEVTKSEQRLLPYHRWSATMPPNSKVSRNSRFISSLAAAFHGRFERATESTPVY